MVAREVVIHVGPPKTATTSIQHALTGSTDMLRAHGWTYLSTGRRSPPHNHRDLINALGFSRAGEGVSDIARSLASELIAEVERAGRGIISHEAFCRFPWLSDRQSAFVRALVRDLNPTVVLYLRRQDRWLESLYSQFVKRGRETRSIEDVAARFGEPYMGFATSYDQMIEFFRSWVTSDARLLVRPFDRRTLVGGDARIDFFRLLGIDEKGLGDRPSFNPSLGPGTVHLMRRIANDPAVQEELDGEGFERLARLIDQHVEGDGASLLSSETRQALLARIRERNRRIEQRFLPDTIPWLSEAVPPATVLRHAAEQHEPVTDAQVLWRALAAALAHNDGPT